MKRVGDREIGGAFYLDGTGKRSATPFSSGRRRDFDGGPRRNFSQDRERIKQQSV
jgi:hypothetical protein